MPSCTVAITSILPNIDHQDHSISRSFKLIITVHNNDTKGIISQFSKLTHSSHDIANQKKQLAVAKKNK